MAYVIRPLLNFGSGYGFGVETGKIPNFGTLSVTAISRPSHLKIPGGPKMARAALSRRAIY